METVDDVEVVSEREDLRTVQAMRRATGVWIKHPPKEHRRLNGRREQGSLRSRVASQKQQVLPSYLNHLLRNWSDNCDLSRAEPRELGEETDRVGECG